MVSMEVTMWMLSCTSGAMSNVGSSKNVMMSSLVALNGRPRIFSTPVCTACCQAEGWGKGVSANSGG